MSRLIRKRDGDIISGIFLSAALAMIFTQAAGVAATIIDGIVTSRFLGEAAYSAVSLLGPFTGALLLIAGFLSTGSQVVCTQMIGNGNKETANRSFSFAAVTTVVLSALILLGCIFFPGALFSVCGVSTAKNEAIYEGMMQYLHGYMIGIPALMLIQILGPMIVMDGGKKLFTLSAAVLCLADVAGDLLNVFVFHGGVFGMGLATSVSFLIQLGMLCTHFLRKNGYFHLDLKCFQPGMVKEIMKAGSPTFVRKLATILRDLLVNRMNLTVALTTAAIAARGVQNDLNTLMFCIGLGIGKTLLSMTGIYYGSNDRNGLKRLFATSMKTSLWIAGIATVACFFGAGPIASLYTDHPEGWELAVFSIRCMALSLILDTILVALQNYLQGIHNRKLVNLMNFAERFFIPVLTAFVLGRLYGSKGIMASLAVGKLLLGLLMLGMICIRKKRFPRSWEDLMFLPDDFGIAEENNREAQMTGMEDVMRESEAARSFCLEHGMDGARAGWMALFVEEMAGNIFHHGKTRGGTPIRVDYRLFVDGNRIGLCLRDSCEPFDAAKYFAEHRDQNDPEHVGNRMVMSRAEDIQYYNTFNSNNLLLFISGEK